MKNNCGNCEYAMTLAEDSRSVRCTVFGEIRSVSYISKFCQLHKDDKKTGVSWDAVEPKETKEPKIFTLEELNNRDTKRLSDESMNKYYKHMPESFKKSVEVISEYCQFEDCNNPDCNDCPHPVTVIRCGDNKNENVSKKKEDLGTFVEIFNSWSHKELQTDINHFIVTTSGIEVKDVKISTCIHDNKGTVVFTAVVLYSIINISENE